jgi:hypothetical protein
MYLLNIPKHWLTYRRNGEHNSVPLM